MSDSRRRCCCLLLLLIGASMMLWAQERFPCQGVTTTTLNVRTGPGTYYTVVGKLPAGTTIHVADRVSDDWLRVEYGTGRRYVSAHYVHLKPLADQSSPSSSSSRHKSRGWSLGDWQNRYNYSWRIRPLYVIDLANGSIQRIPGGMTHWLFRRLVIRDIIDTLDS